MKTQAIKFIVESIQIGHPVFMGYNEIDGEQNLQGHAVLVKEIQYKSDYSTFKYITTWDPQYRSGTIKSFQNYHRVSQNVYNIFSFSKP
ncbi:hypothetical protein [Chryseobacterium sp. 22458]|uniref:hypothetical protein n=1 Tax=Chryseobacterium sp. 22458 TaxID=3453921 RepID=UPI003F869209